jgi:glycosyltransferase involved in cell wall biosynthesis
MHRDDRLAAEVPPDLRVVRTRSFEPRPRRASVQVTTTNETLDGRSVVRRHLGHLKRFPDAHLGWLPFAVAAARSERYDVIYSSSGPFTSHLVGLALKCLTGKPWVAELRDGWYCWNRAIFPDYPAWRDALERRLEAAAIRTADRVVLVTDRMAEAFRAHYPDLPKDHFAVVPNGFDPLQFDGAAPNAPQPSRGWEVLHAGALYYGRSLSEFFRAARCVAEWDMEFARDFRLTLLGTLDQAARAEVDASGLADRVQLRPQVDHAGAIDAMRRADALLLVANTTPGAEATVPGKLFEYLAVGRPVLAVAPAESSTADVLRQTGGGWLAPAGDPSAIACVLQQAYRQRANPVRTARLGAFDRRRLAGELGRVFDQVLMDAARRA